MAALRYQQFEIEKSLWEIYNKKEDKSFTEIKQLKECEIQMETYFIKTSTHIIQGATLHEKLSEEEKVKIRAYVNQSFSEGQIRYFGDFLRAIGML